jgi:hypothetical protein
VIRYACEEEKIKYIIVSKIHLLVIDITNKTFLGEEIRVLSFYSNKRIECHSLVVRNAASYLGGPGFESLPDDRLS